MATVSLEAVLAQARQLTPAEQAQLIEELRPAPVTNAVLDTPADNEDDLAEQRETWAYLQQVLDEDRLSARPLFPHGVDQP